MSEKLYYLYNYDDARKGWYDYCVVWWRPNSAGYTSNLAEAGVYTEEEIATRCNGSRHSTRAVEKSAVDAVAKTVTFARVEDLPPADRPCFCGDSSGDQKDGLCVVHLREKKQREKDDRAALRRELARPA